MKTLTLTICLTLAVLLGSAGTSWGGDYNKGLAAAESGDFATALRKFRPLAEQGNVDAQYNLGRMYGEGYGVPLDDKTALKWYTLAAEQGVASAQTNLGWMYDKGYGVKQDNVYAHMWGNIAASNGNENGGKLRDELAKDMTPADISAAQDLARECVRKEYIGC